VRIQNLTENHLFLIKLSQGLGEEIWKIFLGKEFSKKFSKQALARKNLGFFCRMESRLGVRNIKKTRNCIWEEFLHCMKFL